MVRNIILIQNLLSSNFKKLSFPYKVSFAFTYKCNSKCKICGIWNNSYKDELATAEIDKIFRKMKNISWLTLTGGEIVTREDFLEATRIILKNTTNLLLFQISTNGQSPKEILLLAQEILKLDTIPIITISIDGPKRINDELRGSKDSYFNSLETFKLLKGLNRGHYYLCCTISRYNFNHIDELLSDLKRDMPSFSLSDIHFNIFHTSSHYYNNKDIDGLAGLSFDMVKKYFMLANKKGNFYKKILDSAYIKGLYKYLNGNKFPLDRCSSLNSTCFIDPFGCVYPCSFYGRMLGNLKDYDYDLCKIWNNQEALRARKDIEDRKCLGCWSQCEAYPALLGRIMQTLLSNIT